METLQNNSEMMKTIVETFLIEETLELVYDGEKLEKWNELVKELGLTGQSNLAKPEKSPIPFMHLKKSMINVFETLCPCKVSVKEYGKTPIPVEILGLISLSEKEGYFPVIQIWYDDTTPDPVCLGIIPSWILHKPNTYTAIPGMVFTSKESAEACIVANNLSATPYHFSSQDEHYLLGRWADVKQSFDELKERAVKRFIENESRQAKEMIDYYTENLRKVEINAQKRFN